MFALWLSLQFLVLQVAVWPSWGLIPEPTDLSLRWSLPKLSWSDEGLEIKVSSKKPIVTQLAQLKVHFSQGKWKACFSEAQSLRELTPRGLEAWVRAVQLDCLAREFEELDSLARKGRVGSRGLRGMGRFPASVVHSKTAATQKNSSVSRLREALDSLLWTLKRMDQFPSWFLASPFEQPLREKLKAASLAGLQTAISSTAAMPGDSLPLKIVQAVLKYENWFNSSDRGLIFRIGGQSALDQKKWSLAQSLFLRSLFEEESSEARGILKTLDEKLGTQASEELVARRKDVKDERLAVLPEEQKLADQITKAIQDRKFRDAAHLVAQLVNDFPGGSKAAWASERGYDLLQSAIDTGPSSVSEIASELLRADVVRLWNWAQAAFRSEQYELAARLADGALSKGLTQSKVVFLMARALHFSGDIKGSQKWYEQLVTQFGGTEEAVEGQFLLGLTHYRRGNFKAAVESFDRLLSEPRSSTLEIKTRYWLWKSLKDVDATRAHTEGQFLMARFPLTYYGLVVRQELSSSISDFTDARDRLKSSESGEKTTVEHRPSKKLQLFLSASEKEALERMNILLEAGWVDEAKAEAALLPTPPTPRGRMEMGQLWTAVYDFPRVISSLNRVWEEDPSLIDAATIRMAFPLEFSELIQPEALNRKLEPHLVRSLMRQESAFAIKAVSSSGALGLMQMIPPTAQEVAQDLKIKNLRLPDDLFNPRTNVRFCTYYLAKLLQQFEGNVPLALAAYNAGPGRIKRWIKARGLDPVTAAHDETWFDEIPLQETQGYVKAILRNLILYRWLDQGRLELTPLFWQQPLRALGPKPETAL